MKGMIIPYIEMNIPIIKKKFLLNVPGYSEILVNKGDRISTNDDLAVYDYSNVLESIKIDERVWETLVLQGELVKSGDIIAKKTNGLMRKDSVIRGKSSGVVDLSNKGEIMIREDYVKKYIKSGFSGKVINVDRLNYKISLLISGLGISPLFFHNLPVSYSSLINRDNSDIIFISHKIPGRIQNLSEELFDKITIIDYLMKDEYNWLMSNVKNFSKGVCVLTSRENQLKVSVVQKIFEKIKGNRLFIDKDVIFSTLEKPELKKNNYYACRVGSRVVINSFNKTPISGKILSFKGEYVLVATDEEKQLYSHYLNVFKE